MYNDYTTELFGELWAPHITLGLEGSLRQARLLLQVSSGLAVVFHSVLSITALSDEALTPAMHSRYMIFNHFPSDFSETL